MGIDISLLDLLGFTATAFSVCMWIPQARTTWKSRNDVTRLAGISQTSQWLMMIGYVLWGLFGVLSGSLWVAAPSAVIIPLALATIIIVRRARRLPFVRSVPILSTSDPVTVDETTASIPILSTDDAVPASEISAPGVSPTTGTIPVLA
ncbi:PQ-loop repeat-containing protein [Cryobacterium sp. BB307]|uniref:PQ-loop repeat-containing protein n=1 Tax=Cryobacterium sp. BB307 TaxID=2716317 RepID=UPI00144726C5|nr:PQ-loop repeat-containing protein [Cryobacterium sp. BB307]